jgi:hypothetical protein
MKRWKLKIKEQASTGLYKVKDKNYSKEIIIEDGEDMSIDEKEFYDDS